MIIKSQNLRSLISWLLILCILITPSNITAKNSKTVSKLFAASSGATVETATGGAICVSGGAISVVTNNSFIGDGYYIDFAIDSKWNGAFNGNITITNTSDKVMDNWILEFEWNNEITNIWNAEIQSYKDGIYIIKNAGWNQDIPAGGKVSFGFGATYMDQIQAPTNYKIITEKHTVSNESYQVLFQKTGDWGSGYNAQIQITNCSEQTIEDWILEFDFDAMINLFWTAQILSREGNHYIIKNAGYNANIKPGETLTLGFTGSPGNITIEPTNYILNNMLSGFVDGEECIDSDEDDLLDYEETEYGTDRNNNDTDGDGLWDGYEVYVTKTNPCKIDTDENGIGDGEEDIDQDGFNYIDECKYGTDPFNLDTDMDSLKDSDEVHKYKTDPLLYDTDGDGLFDGDEIKLGLNANASDSNGNGVPDNEEKMQQNVSIDIDPKENSAVKSVSVTMNVTGNMQSSTWIDDISKTDKLTSGVVGLVGIPVEISSVSDFDKATITFSYDEKLLGTTNEKNLRVMWYDEPNNKYVILDDTSVVDTVNNTVSYMTPHFSTYMLVDRERWYDTWNMGSNVSIVNHGGYNYGFILDSSGSMAGIKFNNAKQLLSNCMDFMQSNDKGRLAYYGDHLSVFDFASKNNLKASLNYIDTDLETFYSSDPIPAVYFIATNQLNDNSGKQKIIILASDGECNIMDEQQVNKMKQATIASGVRIYSIYLKSFESPDWMQELAEKTGGKFYSVNSEYDFSSVVADIKDELYTSDNTDSDGDGLLDIDEVNGVRLQNGRIFYSNPTQWDTNGNGISDGIEAGILIDANGKPLISSMSIGISGHNSIDNIKYYVSESKNTNKCTQLEKKINAMNLPKEVKKALIRFARALYDYFYINNPKSHQVGMQFAGSLELLAVLGALVLVLVTYWDVVADNWNIIVNSFADSFKEYASEIRNYFGYIEAQVRDTIAKANGLPTEKEFHDFDYHQGAHKDEFKDLPGGNGKKPDKKDYWKLAKDFLENKCKEIKIKDNPDPKWPGTKIKFNPKTGEFMAYDPITKQIITYYLAKHSVYNGTNLSYWLKKALEYWNSR